MPPANVAPATPPAAPVPMTEPSVAAPRRPDRRADATGPLPRLALVGVFVILLVAALQAAQAFLLPVLIAILLALLLSPAVGALERVRIVRWLGSLIVVIGALALTGALAAYLAAPAQQWIQAGPERLDTLRRKFDPLRLAAFDAQRVGPDRASVDRTAESDRDGPREVVVTRSWTRVLLDDARPVAIGAVSVLVLLYFLLASGDLFLRKLIRVMPKLPDKIRAIEISRSVQQEIGRYFVAVTTINAGLGVVVAVTMAALGMPTPALLGAAAALLNFVPYVGSAVALVMLAIVSAATFESLGAILLPPAAFLLITTLEGQVVQPLVLGRRLSTTTVAMFLWILFWGWLWGFGGVAVAVPLLVAVKICADRLPSLHPLAELLGRD